MERGALILVVGLPGSGKGTLISFVREHYPKVVFPVSWTTRMQRPGEMEGLVYHFATEPEFTRAVKEETFLEWVSIDGGHRYGTPKAAIIEALAAVDIVMREVEVEGARHIRERLPDARIITLFITSRDGWENLSQRMLTRAPMAPKELALRKARYERELKFRDEADYVIDNSNGNLAAAQAHMRQLIEEIRDK